MSIASVSEIKAASTVSFDDAIKSGIERASKTIQNIKSAWVAEQEVRIDGGHISEYRVLLKVTFVLKD